MDKVMDMRPLSDESKEAFTTRSGDYSIFLDIMEN